MQGEARTIRGVVVGARARLGRIAGRRLLIERAWWAVLLGVVAAVGRPIVWATPDGAPLWLGFARSLSLLAASFAAAAIGMLWIGRRRGPSELGAARAIDEARGLSEVVASGFAFERDGRADPVAMLARGRAEEAARTVDARALFALPSLAPSGRTLGRAGLCLCSALCLGAYNRDLWTVIVAPPTESESIAASELEQSAAALAAALQKPPPEAPRPEHPKTEGEKSDERLGRQGPKLAETAREAARAARRGDRQGALEKLDELRNGGRQQGKRAAELGRTLRSIADSLTKPSGAEKSAGASKAAEPSARAAEELRLLAKKTREEGASGGASKESKESEERMLERLERAAEEASRTAGQDGQSGAGSEAQKMAGAMKQAAASLHRGDREAAAAALEQAALHGEAMERARAEAAAEAAMVIEMLEKSDALEQAIELAMLGKEGNEAGQGEGAQAGKEGAGKEGAGKEGAGKEGGKGKGGQGSDGQGKGASKSGGGKGGGSGKGNDLRRALALRLAALGLTTGTGSGTGPDGEGQVPDRHRSHHAELDPKGSIRAPSQVSEGERAIQAIQGLGKGSDAPSSYKEVFPSYDAAVEEGLSDERIPPARRSAVRRYFQAIRPEDP